MATDSKKTLEPGRAKTCALLNLLAWPGLGTLLAGRLIGWPQAATFLGGFLWVCYGFVRMMVILFDANGPDPGNIPGLATMFQGAVVAAVTWVWAAFSSWFMIREARQGDTPPPLPTGKPGP